MSIREGLFTSEAVSAGHPDKVCDRISDAVLDEFLRRDPHARVACETFAADRKILVAGEFRTARQPRDRRPAPRALARAPPRPAPAPAAHRGARARVRPRRQGARRRAQAARGALASELEAVAREVPGFDGAVPAELHVNGAGAFEVGGPEGDNGLSGKQLVMDAYGPRVPIGGGPWSGKVFFKADRAGALYARRLARLMVNVGLAEEVTVTVAFRPGAGEAEILNVRGASLDKARRCARLLDGSLRGSGEGGVCGGGLVEVAKWGSFLGDATGLMCRAANRPSCASAASAPTAPRSPCAAARGPAASRQPDDGFAVQRRR